MCSYYSQNSQIIFCPGETWYSNIYRIGEKCDFHIIIQDGDRNPHLLHKYIQQLVDADKKTFLLHK